MYKTFALILISLVSLFCSQIYAQSVNFKLLPKASKVLTNHFFWTLQATCSIKIKQANNKILVSVVKNKAKVNGHNLVNGQATSLTVHNNDSLSVIAEPGACVNLINLGTDTVEAVCLT